MSLQIILCVALAAFAAGLGKGGLGAALAGSITPVLSLVLPPAEAVGLVLPMLLLGDVLALRLYWRQWDYDQLWLLLPTAIPGILMGTYLLANLSGETMRLTLGILTLAVAAYKLLEKRLLYMRYQPRKWHGWLAGITSALGASLANAGGPTFSAYLLLQGMEPRIFIGTTTLFFSVVNVLRLPGIYLTGVIDAADLRNAVLFLPLVIVGVQVGRELIHRIDPVRFNQIMTLILLIAGVLLLF